MRVVLLVPVVIALAACGGADDASSMAEEAARYDTEPHSKPGAVEPKTASTVELPDIGPDLRRAAGMGGDLPCGLPVMPDNFDGRVLNPDRKDAQFETGASSGEAAAFYQAAAEAKGYSISTRGADEDYIQEIDTHQLRKCTTLIEWSRDYSGGATVVVRFAGG